MKTMKDFWKELKQRWHNAMPQFFKRMMWICGLISGTALAANEAMTVAGIEPHQWWIDIRPYLIAVPAGAMFACKFTQNYDRDGNPVSKPLPEATRPDSVNMSDIETVSATQHPDTTDFGRPAPAENDPYNED